MRDGFAFSTRFKVRYAEIDGQKVVFNSRYLEYADVAATDYWDWTGIGDALGDAWLSLEFHVRRAEVDFLRPFSYGDEVEAFVRTEAIGRTSWTQLIEMTNPATGALHATVRLINVHVDLATHSPTPIPDAVRDYMAGVPG